MYYTLKHKTNKEVGNIFPQVSCLSQNDAHNLSSDEFPNTTPKLIFSLEKKAKLTDVLSQAAINANGLLISEKLKNILKKFNLMKHQFYPATIKTNKKKVQYYWLHLSDISILNKIDYPLSKFFRTEYGFREENLILKSFEDYKKNKKKYGNMGTIESDYIFLKEDLAHQLFTFPIFDNHIYLEQEVYTKLIEENITGINYKKAITINL